MNAIPMIAACMLRQDPTIALGPSTGQAEEIASGFPSYLAAVADEGVVEGHRPFAAAEAILNDAGELVL